MYQKNVLSYVTAGIRMRATVLTVFIAAGGCGGADQSSGLPLKSKELMPSPRVVVAPTPPKALGPPGLKDASSTQEDLLGELHDAIRRCPGQKVNAEVSGQVALYRESGFNVVDGLKAIYRRDESFRVRVLILLMLREIGTSPAADVIDEIAREPGRETLELGARAVKLLSSMGANSDRLSQLLESNSSETRNTAAMELADKDLSETAVDRLGELLKSESWESHNFVISAFATDHSAGNARRKLDLLMKALGRLDDLSDVPEEEFLCSRSPRTFVMCGYITTLAYMRGADEILHEQLSSVTAGSIEYKVLAIASAMRKDQSTRPALLEIARTEKNADLRSMAVFGLQFVGSRNDLEFLRKLAVEDPYVLRVRLDNRNADGELHYPVRWAAERSIEALNK